jgi:hypothetical protein
MCVMSSGSRLASLIAFWAARVARGTPLLMKSLCKSDMHAGLAWLYTGWSGGTMLERERIPVRRLIDKTLFMLLPLMRGISTGVAARIATNLRGGTGVVSLAQQLQCRGINQIRWILCS